MYRDFYTTLAQVLPVLMLALMFDSGYLHRLRDQSRRPRRVDPSGVIFWTKPRVRAYTLFVVVCAVVCLGLSVLVLAGGLRDSVPLRVTLTLGTLLVLATFLTRVGIDIVQATADARDPADPPQER